MKPKYAKLTSISGGIFSLFNILLGLPIHYVQEFNINVEGLMRRHIPEGFIITHFTDPQK